MKFQVDCLRRAAAAWIVLILIPATAILPMAAAAADDRVVLPWAFCRQNWIASVWCGFLCGWVPALFACEPEVMVPTQAPALATAFPTLQINPPFGGGELLYYQTCGDPVCRGWSAKEGIPICDDDGAPLGQPCDTKGFVCDPVDSCNALITCTDQDPRTSPGGCPISYRHTKKDIHYLDQERLREVTDSLLSFQLATWNYKHESTEAGSSTDPHLGFIIEDVLLLGAEKKNLDRSSTSSSSPAIDEKRGMVDLYGYLSMAVAAIQTQQREINDLRSEIELLKTGGANVCSGGVREEDET